MYENGGFCNTHRHKTNARLFDSAHIGLYHSSKAAVTVVSETLRLELAPLGVTVITDMLGNIESNFYVNDSWQGVLKSSRYKSVEGGFALRALHDVNTRWHSIKADVIVLG